MKANDGKVISGNVVLWGSQGILGRSAINGIKEHIDTLLATAYKWEAMAVLVMVKTE